ncbi:uncharacterized protein E0L32_006767 [Thyridium curvatum]|uniref:Uncharacterized protein n=1 Tax=Thyridium curvatum TaxID=1093900 RepID=A0A507AZE1_9PEZI|nr:uncharacterized protein E0L32_006767 [Thyridium curvatum]TPX12887.1 hypothetical protein E0L32_006767 [Thyridium curvatum]
MASYVRWILMVLTLLHIAGVQACVPCGCGCGGRCGHIVKVVESNGHIVQVVQSDVVFPASSGVSPVPNVSPNSSPTSIPVSTSTGSFTTSTVYASSTSSSSSPTSSPTPAVRPIAGAWLYLSDDANYNTIPAEWSAINFANVDALFIGPAGIQADGSFGLFSSNTTGPLANRFQWALETARAQNPAIKIAISQWWGQGQKTWGLPLSALIDEASNSTTSEAVDAYAASVRAFFQQWAPVAGGLDGFDVDYEDNNLVPFIGYLFGQVRQQLSGLTASTGREYWVTVSPSDTDYLETAASSLSYVNMQTYAGGVNLTPEDFLNIGYRKDQLLYGVCPETNCPGPTVAEAEGVYTKYSMAGIHVWRLNSDNYVYEGQVQKQVYDFLHG